MKRLLKSPIAATATLSIPVLLFSWFIATREVAELQSGDPLINRNRTQVTGGIERPESDLIQARFGQISKLGEKAAAEAKATKDISIEFGKVTCPKVPILEKGLNPQMDSVIEAIETGSYHERLSPIIAPRPFDREAWRADPQNYQTVSDNNSQKTSKKLASPSGLRFVSVNKKIDPKYLSTSEPGRIYDVMQPGRGIKVLRNISNPRSQIVEGESVFLSVKTEPFAPVSFTAFSMGKFENGLMAVTIAANAGGLAKTSFTGTTGPSIVDIVAGSPMTTGTVRFQIVVQPRITK